MGQRTLPGFGKIQLSPQNGQVKYGLLPDMLCLADVPFALQMRKPPVSTPSPVSGCQCYLPTGLELDIRLHMPPRNIVARKTNTLVSELKPIDKVTKVIFFIRYKLDL